MEQSPQSAPRRTFKHSGDMGDIMLSLPAVRALGGGVLYLDPEGGVTEPLVNFNKKGRTKLTRAGIDRFRPLLERQPYITEVRYWNGEPVDYNLDQFRSHMSVNNVADAHLAAFGLDISQRDQAWLQITDPLSDPRYPVIISRSVRYHGNHSFWENNLHDLLGRCAFVGYPKDHEVFEYTFDCKVPFWDAPDILTLARIIAGCQALIANQGLPHTIGEALKKDVIIEVFRPAPMVIFQRPGAQYV